MDCTEACSGYVPIDLSHYRVAEKYQEVEDEEKSEGFWGELFLLKPDLPQFREILENTDPEFLIHIQVRH